MLGSKVFIIEDYCFIVQLKMTFILEGFHEKIFEFYLLNLTSYHLDIIKQPIGRHNIECLL